MMMAGFVRANPYLGTRSSSSGETADFVNKKQQKITKTIREVLSNQWRQTELFQQLEEIWEVCSSPDWDGYQALPIEWSTYLHARRLVESLSSNIPAPTFGTEPDGQITLEWYSHPRRLLSVSVSPDSELHYAATINSSKIYGTEKFWDVLPNRIRDLAIEVTKP
jgi:hypothetical protein